MKTTLAAVLKAQKLIRQEAKWSIPDHRISLVLTTEPDQYRLTYRLPDHATGGVDYDIVPRLTLTPIEFQAWEAWLASSYMTGGRP